MKELVYNDFISLFAELLEKDNSVTVHQINLQILGIEMSEVKNNLAPIIMSELVYERPCLQRFYIPIC